METTDETERLDRLERMFDHIHTSERDRQVYRLREVDGLPYAAVAEQVGIDENHAMVIVCRIKKQWRGRGLWEDACALFHSFKGPTAKRKPKADAMPRPALPGSHPRDFM